MTTRNTVSKCVGDFIEEYYMKEKQLVFFLVIDKANMLLQLISLFEIIKEFDKVALLSATANDIKHFDYFRDPIIVNTCAIEKYNRNINITRCN